MKGLRGVLGRLYKTVFVLAWLGAIAIISYYTVAVLRDRWVIRHWDQEVQSGLVKISGQYPERMYLTMETSNSRDTITPVEHKAFLKTFGKYEADWFSAPPTAEELFAGGERAHVALAEADQKYEAWVIKNASEQLWLPFSEAMKPWSTLFLSLCALLMPLALMTIRTWLHWLIFGNRNPR